MRENKSGNSKAAGCPARRQRIRDERMRGRGTLPAKLALGICVSLILTGVAPVQAADYPSYSQYQSGETARSMAPDDYITINVSTEAELTELAENCRLDSWSRDKYVRLEADIVLRENRGLAIAAFSGIFDGGGHGISGLEIREAGSAMGLFRYVQEGGVVRNLSVSGTVSPEGSRSRLGLIAGVNYGRIENCSVSGTVNGDEEAGGIAGVNEKTGEIRACRSSAVVSGSHFTGGICGINRGVLNNCGNYGGINIFATEVTYDIEDITVESLEDINDTGKVSAHTDTGGIAGYSEGKIYYCLNSGSVGYPHVGYNTGGIVGRLHQGYIQNCTNEGLILGRKDVGGIVGQMEPFLEVEYLDDKLKEIDRETGKFLDLLEKTQRELSAYSRQATELTKRISRSLAAASEAAGELIGTANDLWYIYNQELSGIGKDIDRLTTEIDEIEKRSEENVRPSGGGPGNITVSGGDIIGDHDGIFYPDQGFYDSIREEAAAYRAALKRFGESTGDHLDQMTSETSDRSGGINANLDTLNRELGAAGDDLIRLSDVLEQGTDVTTANLDALNAQARVLRVLINELRNDLFRYEGISMSDASDEDAGGVPDHMGAVPPEDGSLAGAGTVPEGGTSTGEEVLYDTDSFQQGKITLCVNQGTVEADTNVGGIVGQVSTEYDFDPEDDITFTGAESFNIEQTVKAVIRESRNMGNVTGKKDCVGGIVGKADFGAVISCESYGDISSSSGSYVGGIAGSSSYAVRNCYFMGDLSGKNYVGGIAGKGCDIFYSYSYPAVAYTGEYAGSVAGQVDEDGILCGNYYVEGGVDGIDSIAYAEGASPLPYEEFRDREGMPEAFRVFTVTFRADGRELASVRCQYGDSIESSQIPEIPEREGCYGVWDDFDFSFVTGNRILEAKYEKWISTLASEETDEAGRARVLAQGAFLPDMRLNMQETPEGIRLSVAGPDEEGGTAGRQEGEVLVRARCEDPEHTIVEILEGGGYRRADGAAMGSYVEFAMEMPGTFRLTVEDDRWEGMAPVVAAAAAVLALGLVLSLCVRAVRKRRKRKGQSSAEEGDKL